MAIRLITVISMTDLNNSNADEERPNAAPNGGEGASSNADDLDAAWAEFASSHADDLQAVEHSRSAKRFEIRARSLMTLRKVVDRAISLVPAGWTPIV